jgi:2-polyprenyl-3-methyl-5-hydroxy-6-metoxy-1,4-benzoquinol methylase
MRLEIIYDQKFDITRTRKYTIKNSTTSLHHFIRILPVEPSAKLLDLGGGDGRAVSLAHACRGVSVTVVDQSTSVADEIGNQAAGHPNIQYVTANLDSDWTSNLQGAHFHTVFALDILEHLNSPESAVSQIFSLMHPRRKTLCEHGKYRFHCH